MGVDARSALAMQRMYHGPGPDDFTWGRWYWCQEGAEDLPIDTAYSNGVWQQEPGVFFGAGGFRMTPSPFLPLDVEANGNYQTKGDVYAVSRVSPWPGLEYHGEDEWYLRGVPASELIDLPAGPICGVDAWDSTMELSVTISSQQVTGPVIGVGIGGSDPDPPIEYVGSGVTVFSSFSQRYGVVLPPSRRAGDLAVMFFSNCLDSREPAIPPGWTLITGGDDDGDAPIWRIVCRVLDGFEAVAVLMSAVGGGGVPVGGAVVVVRGEGLAIAAGPVSTGAGVTLTADEFTAPDGALLWLPIASTTTHGDTTFAGPPQMVVGPPDINGGGNHAQSWSQADWPGGPTGDRVVTATHSGLWATLLIAILPAS